MQAANSPLTVCPQLPPFWRFVLDYRNANAVNLALQHSVMSRSSRDYVTLNSQRGPGVIILAYSTLASSPSSSSSSSSPRIVDGDTSELEYVYSHRRLVVIDRPGDINVSLRRYNPVERDRSFGVSSTGCTVKGLGSLYRLVTLLGTHSARQCVL